MNKWKRWVLIMRSQIMEDKALHLSVGFIIAVLLPMFFSLIVTCSLLFLIAIGKEMWDYGKTNHTSCIGDLIWTLAGGFIGLMPILLFKGL